MLRFGKAAVVQALLFVLILLAFDYWTLSSRASDRISRAELNPIVAQLTADELSRFEEGEPLLVYVWATWCSICYVSSPRVDEYSADYLTVSVVLQSGSNDEVSRYLMDQGYSFPFYNDAEGRWSRALDVAVTPTFLWVDSSGEILYISRGYTSELGLKARRLLLAD